MKDNNIHARTRSPYAQDFDPKNGLESFSKLFDPSKSYNPHPRLAPNQIVDNTSVPLSENPIISRALSAEQRASYSDPWDQSFGGNSSTVPNSPIVDAQTPDRPPPALKPSAPARVPNQVLTNGDVGFPSLDAAMDSHLGDALQISAEKSKFLSDLEHNINEGIAQNMAGVRSMTELPKPTILKAGFDPKGSFKGDRYDSEVRI